MQKRDVSVVSGLPTHTCEDTGCHGSEVLSFSFLALLELRSCRPGSSRYSDMSGRQKKSMTPVVTLLSGWLMEIRCQGPVTCISQHCQAGFGLPVAIAATVGQVCPGSRDVCSGPGGQGQERLVTVYMVDDTLFLKGLYFSK